LCEQALVVGVTVANMRPVEAQRSRPQPTAS
jgi:hypothetical protein